MCPSAFQPTSADSCLTESADPADFLMHQKKFNSDVGGPGIFKKRTLLVL